MESAEDVEASTLAFDYLRAAAAGVEDSRELIAAARDALQGRLTVMDLRNIVWRKSTRSSGGGNNGCVEVADAGQVVAVRDSKDRSGAVLTFPRAAWHTFVNDARSR